MRQWAVAMLSYRADEMMLGAWTVYASTQDEARDQALCRVQADYPAADGWKHASEAQEVTIVFEDIRP